MESVIKTYKTVAETEEALGVKRDTVYRLLRARELERVPTPIKSGRGRPATYISVSSIVNYIKTH